MVTSVSEPVVNPALKYPKGWYPVAALSQLKNRRLNAIEICGLKLMAFSTDAGAMVYDCACPHMGMDLSRGKLKDSEIICPYHNAAFSIETGNYCGKVFVTPMHLRAYPSVIRFGWIWAWIGGGKPLYELPDYSEAQNDFTWQKVTVPANFVNFMLNSIDSLHFLPRHSKWLSREERFCEVEAINDYAFRSNLVLDPDARGWLGVEQLERTVWGPSLSINAVKTRGSVKGWRVIGLIPRSLNKTTVVMFTAVPQKQEKSPWSLMKLMAPFVNALLFFQDLEINQHIISERRKPDVKSDQAAIYYLRVLQRLRRGRASSTEVHAEEGVGL